MLIGAGGEYRRCLHTNECIVSRVRMTSFLTLLAFICCVRVDIRRCTLTTQFKR